MKIIFFDGYCSLCNGLVDWMVNHDPKGVLKFASLQGETAKQQLPSTHLKVGEQLDTDTVIYWRDGKIYERSTAILMALSDLQGVWQAARVLLIIPPFLRNIIYRLVARYRYKIFGRREECRVPLPEERARLLP